MRLCFFVLIFLLQIIRAILENPKDKTKVHLIYANVTVDDILLKVILLLKFLLQFEFTMLFIIFVPIKYYYLSYYFHFKFI